MIVTLAQRINARTLLTWFGPSRFWAFRSVLLGRSPSGRHGAARNQEKDGAARNQEKGGHRLGLRAAPAPIRYFPGKTQRHLATVFSEKCGLMIEPSGSEKRLEYQSHGRFHFTRDDL